MGRVIRRVPPNWSHPKMLPPDDDLYIPIYNAYFEDAASEWVENFLRFKDKEFYYWEIVGMPPLREDYLPYKKEVATWYQVYETVTDGTPVTPPFATQQELVDYLVQYGDFADQKRGMKSSYPRGGAEKFVYVTGCVPSFGIKNGEIKRCAELLDDLDTDDNVKEKD